jgi:hypothetical protein
LRPACEREPVRMENKPSPSRIGPTPRGVRITE